MVRHLSLGVFLVGIAGCYGPSIQLGVPCGTGGECPRGQECDPATRVCREPTELQIWRDDTADDFAQPGAVLGNAAIEPAGFVGPIPYATGYVRLAGIAADTIGDVATATWEAASAGTITGRAFARSLAIDYNNDAPYGLGLTQTNGITVLVEGEIFLDATGEWGFRLLADDKGFVDIAAPGEEFTRLVTDEDTQTTSSYSVAAAGWYRIRAAFTDNSSLMTFRLEVDSPVLPGNFTEIAADAIRARVDDLGGYVLDGFDQTWLTGYIASTLDPGPLERSIGTNGFDLPLGFTTLSFRWSGQILIEVGGEYAFTVTSHQGHRLWIDGVPLADTPSSMTTTAPIMLEPGWHDLVADVSKRGSDLDTVLEVTVASGPAWVGEPIPATNVRPVVGRGVRWVSASTNSDLAIPDTGSATRTLSVELPVGFVAESIAATYEIDHAVQSSVGLVLDPPVGSNVTLISAGSLSGSGAYYDDDMVPASSAGSTWRFIASDTVADTTTGVLSFAGVTLVGRGGVAPFATAVRYESAPRDLGDVVGFGAATWRLRQGTLATVQLRTCDDAAACASEPWTQLSYGTAPQAPPRRFAQYAVELTTDGDIPTALDWFELTYSARGE